ncbi:hypothetical protein [Methylobacterium pseudosasicola]|uniref:Uncharacterized protein n=1 Tax=Methylobacterium pseudosasicola TaxID=582667 RepID=A0A1I4SZ72_9HYPH|nr:hypothetical protein [Methylobacterium pseudosasicola]SFM69762.1 hypothetical protein SAMN05192568_104719 [Methylobacterium pseudosasicola]
MTDAGGFVALNAAPRLSEQERLLRQLADMLNLPISVFRRRTDPTAEGPTARECAAILAAFSRIRDPDARRRCLAKVERCADA